MTKIIKEEKNHAGPLPRLSHPAFQTVLLGNEGGVGGSQGWEGTGWEQGEPGKSGWEERKVK